MEQTTRVFIPLRSNAWWFQGPALIESLGDRIKRSLLVYDEIVIEDGTYQASFTDSGAVEFYLPPGKLPEEMRSVQPDRDVNPTIVSYSFEASKGKWIELAGVSGPTVARLKIDFYDFWKNSSLRKAEFVSFQCFKERKEPSEARDRTVRVVKEWNDGLKGACENPFLRKTIAKGLVRDIEISGLLKASTVIDPESFRYLTVINEKVFGRCMNVSLPDLAGRHLIRVAAPLFASLTVDDVLDLRRNRNWRDFRRLLGELVAETCRAISEGKCELDVDQIVSEKAGQRLFARMRDSHMGGSGLSIDLLLGGASLIPGYGVVATAGAAFRSTAKWLRECGDWSAFLLSVDRVSQERGERAERCDVVVEGGGPMRSGRLKE